MRQPLWGDERQGHARGGAAPPPPRAYNSNSHESKPRPLLGARPFGQPLHLLLESLDGAADVQDLVFPRAERERYERVTRPYRLAGESVATDAGDQRPAMAQGDLTFQVDVGPCLLGGGGKPPPDLLQVRPRRR